MSTTNHRLQIYTVVEIWRGMAQGVRNFKRLSDANKYMSRVRRRLNPIADEVSMFKSSLRISR